MTTGLLITTAGQAAIAADIAGGADLVLTHVAFGDAGGVPYPPNAAQVGLVNERYRATIASVAVVAGAIVIDAVIPADTPDGSARPSHGFNIAEAGIYSAAGTLVGIARMGNGYKPPPSSGQASVATFRFKLAVANPAAISVVIDPQAQTILGRNVRAFFLAVDGVLNEPPSSPANGDTYIVGAAASGAWSGFSHRIAQWVGVWSMASVPRGHIVVDNSKDIADAARWLERSDAGWSNARASESRYGPTILATTAEHTPGVLDSKAAHPKGVKAMIDAAIAALVGGAGAALDTLKELGDALAGYVAKQPLARALQTIAGSLIVEPTSAATVPLTAKGLAGQSAAIIEGYVDTTRRVAFSASGGLVLTGTGTSIDLEYPGSTWRMQASASNFEFYKNGTRITTFGIGVGVGSVYSAQIDCNNLNGMAIAVANIAQTFGAISFRTSAGNEIGSITVNPSSQTTQYNTTSDADLKILEGEAEYDPALLRRLKIVWYRWRAMPEGAPQRGALAQEVYLIWPEAVTVGRGKPGDMDYVPWSMDWSKLVPLLILEAQATDKRLADLEDFVATSTSEAAETVKARVAERAASVELSEAEKEERYAAALAAASWPVAPPIDEAAEQADPEQQSP